MAAIAIPLCKRAALLACCLLAGCSVLHQPSPANAGARLTPATPATRDLVQLPEPRGKVTAAVYAFRDQTGQYKPAPDSSFSSAVTQGATALLVKALQDSSWFTVVERENLQDLLTERKIVRALELPSDKAAPVAIPQLMPASIIIEGGIIGFDSNVRTGGIGASYLGIALSSQYRVDQVTVGLRSVDTRTGQIIDSVSTTKTIYSYEVRPTVFKFVNFKDMVQFESGMTRNEPAQLCVREAIESAVVHLIVQGLRDHLWALKDEQELSAPVIKRYLRELDEYQGPVKPARLARASAAAPANPPAPVAAAPAPVPAPAGAAKDDATAGKETPPGPPGEGEARVAGTVPS
jgi:curli production assembly/transport component CsgG